MDRFLRILCLAALIALWAGCQSSNRFGHNKAAARDIVIAASAYTLDATAAFPTALTNLVPQMLKSVPKCLCEDGKLRDFIYISGFTIADSDKYVIAASPPEMDAHIAIIARINGRVEVVAREKANLELTRSYEHLRKRQQGEPD